MPRFPPQDRDYEGSSESLLDYLRFVVVEVVTPSVTAKVARWMERVCSGLINALYTAKHPVHPKEEPAEWRAWVDSSVIMYVHNATVLEVCGTPHAR